MTKNRSLFPILLGASTLTCLAIGVPMSAHASTPITVQLSPGDQIQAAVTSAPAGSTFLLAPGVYRMQNIVPKNSDIFEGQGTGVILNGSQVLTFQPDPAGTGYWVASATPNNTPYGTCDSTHPLCAYVQDLFVNSVLQTPATTLQGLTAGSWYFDRTNGIVYLPTNPSDSTVELGMQPYAFSGTATGVQISNMTVEKYATPAQWGAVGGNTSGNSWVVNNVEASWNHGAGIDLGSNSQILNSYVHNNGQLGIKLFGTLSKALNNELSWNNYAGFDTDWEAGGGKFWSTTNLTVENNYVHDNNGKGLWTDTNNIGTNYQNNMVINNSDVGIQHELSYAVVIANNVIEGNDPATVQWLGNAQIRIMTSSNAKIYNNTIQVPTGFASGIAVVNESQSSGTVEPTQGPWIAQNNYVHNNTITYLGTFGQSGLQDDTASDTSLGNIFDYNHYIASNCAAAHWAWFGSEYLSGMRTLGQEIHGSCTTSN
jgi:Right handed beta helix region